MIFIQCVPLLYVTEKPDNNWAIERKRVVRQTKKVFASLENVAKNEERSKTMGFYLADSFIATDRHHSVGCENWYSEAIETFLLLLLPFSC